MPPYAIKRSVSARVGRDALIPPLPRRAPGCGRPVGACRRTPSVSLTLDSSLWEEDGVTSVPPSRLPAHGSD